MVRTHSGTYVASRSIIVKVDLTTFVRSSRCNLNQRLITQQIMKLKNSVTIVSILILVIIFSTFLASQLGKNVWTSTLLMVLFGVIGIAGLVKLRHPVILELGAIGFVADTVWELYGTGNRLWGYYDSPFYMIGGTLPIEVAVLYFFLGMTAAAFVLYRMQK